MKIEVDPILGTAAIIIAVVVGAAVLKISDGVETMLENSSVKYEVTK